jgi:hypothetical protein
MVPDEVARQLDGTRVVSKDQLKLILDQVEHVWWLLISLHLVIA